MPAEWEPQTAIWLALPHEKSDWPGKLDVIKWVYADIIRHLSKSVRVKLLVKSEKIQKVAEEILSQSNVDLAKVDIIITPTNRSWLRDSCPIFVRHEDKKVLLDFQFNAWAKYDNWRHDNNLIHTVAEHTELPAIQPLHNGKRVVLEGGSIDVNGTGTLLTTRECLLSDIQCRNPGFTQTDYEAIFATYFGATNTIWLENGIVGDDTHGHVDDLARFINPTTIVTIVESNKQDENYHTLQDNLKILKNARSETGKPFDIIELPMPSPIVFDNFRLPASYANFLIANNMVLVPVFNDKNDRIALDILAKAMPQHEIIGIYCGDFVLGLGTIHCASQQEIA